MSEQVAGGSGLYLKLVSEQEAGAGGSQVLGACLQGGGVTFFCLGVENAHRESSRLACRALRLKPSKAGMS